MEIHTSINIPAQLLVVLNHIDLEQRIIVHGGCGRWAFRTYPGSRPSTSWPSPWARASWGVLDLPPDLPEYIEGAAPPQNALQRAPVRAPPAGEMLEQCR